MSINEKLYNTLKLAVSKQLIKGKEVRIQNPGQRMHATYSVDPITGRTKLKVANAGESYWVCCPTCGDTRYRLCINHRWNTWDDTLKSNNMFLVHCFNEECQSKIPDFMDRLKRLLNDCYAPYGNEKVIEVKENVIQTDISVTPPGLTARIDTLDADHPAYKFFTKRNLDPKVVGPNYDVAYCYLSNYLYAQNRIIFPVKQNNSIVGWQARYIDVNGDGNVTGLYACKSCRTYHKSDTKLTVCPRCHSDNIGPVPKYWTAPGFKKGQALMNYDNAAISNYKFVILVEGPMDVIAVGSPEGPGKVGPAVALYGHTLSSQQKLLLYEKWRNQNIIILLDPDVWADAEELAFELSNTSVFSSVVNIKLPEGMDPGDCDHESLWQLIYESARKHNVSLVSLLDK